MKTAAKTSTEETIESIKNTSELSQKTVDMLLKNTIQSMEVANNYFQNLIKTNLDAQNAGIEAARAYYQGLAEIQKGWFGLYAANTEKAVNWLGEVSANYTETVNKYSENLEQVVAGSSARNSGK